MARVPRDDPGQASDGELVVAGHAAPVPCVVRKAPQQQEGCRPDGRQLLGQVGERPLVGTRFRRVGGLLTANITAGDHVSLTGTARSATLAVGLDPAGPCHESGKTGVNRRDSQAWSNTFSGTVLRVGVRESRLREGRLRGRESRHSRKSSSNPERIKAPSP